MQQQKQIVCVLPHVSAVCDEGSITMTFVIRLLKVGTSSPLDTDDEQLRWKENKCNASSMSHVHSTKKWQYTIDNVMNK